MSAEVGTPLFETKDDLVRYPAGPMVPLPRNMRELFGFLALYDRAQGLEQLLSRLDLSGIGPLEVYRLVHGRPPESARAAVRTAHYDAARKIGEALVSPEFRAHVLRHFLRAFPEKRRDVFIHVPKCAGTDLSLNVAPRRLSFPLMIETVGTEEEFLACIGALSRSVRCFDDIFVYGHMRLGDYVAAVGVQPFDRIFTVIREPIDMLISQVTDALGQVLRDTEVRLPETRERLDYLGIDQIPPNPSATFVKGITVKAMLDERIAPRDPICNYLGTAPNANYRSAMQNIVLHDVEVTTLPFYSRWLAERWQVKAGSRHNASLRWLSINEVQRFLHEKVRKQHSEDRKLYDVVAWCLAQKGTLSVRGLEIAEMAGDSLLDDFPERIRAEGDESGVHGVSLAPALPFIAAQGEWMVDRYSAPSPVQSPAHREHIVQMISFGVGGNAELFQREGWSRPDDHSTWTVGFTSTLEFDRPIVPGSYVLRTQVRPFVFRDKLPSQTVALAVNGTTLAKDSVRDVAVLECDIPWALLAAHETVRITLDLPTAACPTEVNGHPNDARQLGLALQWLKLVRFGGSELATAESSDASPLSTARGMELSPLPVSVPPEPA